MSLDRNDLPVSVRESGKTTFRSIVVDGEEIEFSEGFTDLHTLSYEQILMGNGFGLEEVKPSIETAFEIRNANPAPLKGEYHPFLKNNKR